MVESVDVHFAAERAISFPSAINCNVLISPTFNVTSAGEMVNTEGESALHAQKLTRTNRHTNMLAVFFT